MKGKHFDTCTFCGSGLSPEVDDGKSCMTCRAEFTVFGITLKGPSDAWIAASRSKDWEATGVKHDKEKPRWDLLPLAEISEVVDVMTYGAKKYSEYNWQKVDRPNARYTAAAMRHIVAWSLGEKKDPESGKHHLAHAICCLLFLIWFDNTAAKEPNTKDTKCMKSA